MARFPSIDSEGQFEAPEVQNSIKELVTGSTDGITVDTSVGTRVFVGDTMIYGDTGWRILTPSNGWAGEIKVRRVGEVIELRFAGLVSQNATSGEFISLPQGFAVSIGITDRIRDTAYIRSPFQMVRLFAQNRGVSLDHNLGSDSLIDGNITAMTQDQWPTSLPGLPA